MVIFFLLTIGSEFSVVYFTLTLCEVGKCWNDNLIPFAWRGWDICFFLSVIFFFFFLPSLSQHDPRLFFFMSSCLLHTFSSPLHVNSVIYEVAFFLFFSSLHHSMWYFVVSSKLNQTEVHLLLWKYNWVPDELKEASAGDFPSVTNECVLLFFSSSSSQCGCEWLSRLHSEPLTSEAVTFSRLLGHFVVQLSHGTLI